MGKVYIVKNKPKNYCFHALTRDGRIAQLMAVGFVVIIIPISFGMALEVGLSDFPMGANVSLYQMARSIANNLAELALFSVFPLWLGLVVMHRFADIGVGPDGLAVQVYLCFWALVPWDSVVAVDSRWLTGESRYEQAIILVRRLTIWHRFVTAAYMMSLTPGIPITTYHQDWKGLLQAVRDHLAPQARSGKGAMFDI